MSAGAVSSGDVVGVFKKVYGPLQDLQPANFPLERDIPFDQSIMVGDQFIIAVNLTAEVGWTIGGDATEAFTISPAIAGTTKQISVTPSATIVTSVIPFGVASRSAKVGETAFKSATKMIVKNNLKSHSKLLEILRLYGRATYKLGRVSYCTATYRGVALTNGGGVIPCNGTNVTFTAGVNTSSKWILFQPGDFAAGIWCGCEGAVVKEIETASGAVVGSGKLVEVDAEKGAIKVDFTPVAASSTTSHHICFDRMEDNNDAMGIEKILSTTTGTLFDVSVTQYSLWRPVAIACGATLWTFAWLSNGVAQASNRGGLGDGDMGGGDLMVYMNPRTWAKLIQTEAGRRSYDQSYSEATARNGARAIEFFTEVGKATLKTHRMVKEGLVFGLHLPDWQRSGSAEISFNIPGIDKEVIFALENQAGWCFRSYADQFILCHAPARSIIWTGVNDESAS